MRYEPPALPSFLASSYNLRPVTDDPTDAELNLIHGAIRAAKAAQQVTHVIPGLCEDELVMSLEEHLFDVQMARYKSKYDCTHCRKDMVHRPPDLPDYISNQIPLSSIVGFPSDKNLRAVKTVIRVHEGFMNTPLFDEKLSTDLSQYHFELQMARHIQQASQFDNSIRPKQHPITKKNAIAANLQGTTQNINTRGKMPLDCESSALSEGGSPSCQGEAPVDTAPESNIFDALNSGQEQTNKILNRTADILENVKRILISAQHCKARSDSLYSNGHSHELINEQGEYPSATGLPALWGKDGQNWKKPSEEALVRYLLFYNIGAELLASNNGTTTLAAGMSDRASDLLKKYVWRY
ncbi:laminin domain protein [Ceratobasidium sp. AG-Ba]|nr:laminin domain protein [Ceratobasidium sp. AG-Ba]